ncbi:hypothetical protein ACTXT7_012166 [Hymenolepis weldensis]
MSNSDLPEAINEFVSISADLFDAVNVYEIIIEHLKANPSSSAESEFENMRQNCRRLAIRAQKVQRQLMVLSSTESVDEAKFCKLAIEGLKSQLANFISLLAEMNGLKNKCNLGPKQKQSGDQR